MRGMGGFWRVGLTNRVAYKMVHCRNSLYCLASRLVRACTASCALLISCRKAVQEAGGRSAMDHATGGGQQTCG